MEIRKALRKDIEAIAPMMHKIFSKEPYNENATIADVKRSLHYFLYVGEAYVAVEEDSIVAIIIFKIEQWWEGPVILIEDLAVDETHQLEGIGKTLLEKVDAYAENIKAKSIYFYTHKKASATEFYKRQGFELEKDVISMKKQL